MAVGNSNMVGIPYAPLGRTIMGGLIFSTSPTLFVVPVFYALLDDLRMLLVRIVSAVFARSGTAPYAENPTDD